MNSRYKFFETIYNDDIKHTQKGFLREDIKEILSGEDDIVFFIENEYKYRPDKIALKFYDDPKLYWILVYVNDINNSPQGFESGIYIRVPRPERIDRIL